MRAVNLRYENLLSLNCVDERQDVLQNVCVLEYVWRSQFDAAILRDDVCNIRAV